MKNITVVEHLNGHKALLYGKPQIENASIKRVVERIIGDGEFEQIEKMNTKEVKELIERVLNYKGIFND